MSPILFDSTRPAACAMHILAFIPSQVADARLRRNIFRGRNKCYEGNRIQRCSIIPQHLRDDLKTLLHKVSNK
jgi:hypothetical protein